MPAVPQKRAASTCTCSERSANQRHFKPLLGCCWVEFFHFCNFVLSVYWLAYSSVSVDRSVVLVLTQTKWLNQDMTLYTLYMRIALVSLWYGTYMRLVVFRKVFEMGRFGKGVCNWSLWERCLQLVSLRKVFAIGQFAQGVWIWSVCARCLLLVSLRKVFETGLFVQGVWNWSVCARCLKLFGLRKVFKTGLFAQGVWNWSVWERCLKLVSLRSVFETGRFAKVVWNLSVWERLLKWSVWER